MSDLSVEKASIVTEFVFSDLPSLGFVLCVQINSCLNGWSVADLGMCPKF